MLRKLILPDQLPLLHAHPQINPPRPTPATPRPPRPRSRSTHSTPTTSTTLLPLPPRLLPLLHAHHVHDAVRLCAEALHLRRQRPIYVWRAREGPVEREVFPVTQSMEIRLDVAKIRPGGGVLSVLGAGTLGVVQGRDR